MVLIKTFTINNHKWVIEEKPGEELLEIYKERTGNNSYMCNGLTFYKDHKIWIAKELCDDEKLRTLKHELTHCYIWEMGFYNVEFNYEEVICDFVATIYDFINEVIESEVDLTDKDKRQIRGLKEEFKIGDKE